MQHPAKLSNTLVLTNSKTSLLLPMLILWSIIFKKLFIEPLFLLRGLCKPRVLNSFSLYFNFNFRKAFVIGFKKYNKEIFVCRVWIAEGLNPIQDGPFHGCTLMMGGGRKGKNLSHISYNDETWQLYLS